MKAWHVGVAVVVWLWWKAKVAPYEVSSGTALPSGGGPLLPSGAPSRPSWGNPRDWELWGNGSRSDPFVWANLATGEYAA